MKKFLLLAFVAVVAVCVSCAKEKNCRCSVAGSQSVHVITIKGDCGGLNTIEYTDNRMDARNDSLFCVDYD